MASPLNPMVVQRRMEARGEILYMLDANRGMDAPIKVGWIMDALRSKPEIAQEVPAQIAFLRRREYIEVTTQEETPEMRPNRSAYILLTDKGQDLVEGHIEDNAVLFGDAERH